MPDASDPLELEVTRIDSLPDGLEALELAARAEGFDFLDRGRREWDAGANRHALPGEALFAARLDGRLVGIAGLNVDPYVEHASDEPWPGRLRHLYVLPDARRRGVARALVVATLDAARGAFALVRLRTTNPAAHDFYAAMGFAPLAGDATATHAIRVDAG